MSDAFRMTVGHDGPGYLLLRIEGLLDGRSVTQMLDRCASVASEGRRLILNLSGVTMVTSSGIGGLLALIEEHGRVFGNVRIAEPSAAFTAVVRVLNLDQFLVIDATEEQAVRAAEAA
jgi:anti-anti-sigma factor